MLACGFGWDVATEAELSGAGRTGTKELAQRLSQAPNGSAGVCLLLSRDERECSKAKAKGKGRTRRAKGALVTATRRFAVF